MATQKELEITQDLLSAAIAVNSSNENVNVQVDVQRFGVSIRIAPDKKVLNPVWEWLFYPESAAYFSTDVFGEETFAERCAVFMTEINKHMISADADGVPV